MIHNGPQWAKTFTGAAENSTDPAIHLRNNVLVGIDRISGPATRNLRGAFFEMCFRDTLITFDAPDVMTQVKLPGGIGDFDLAVNGVGIALKTSLRERFREDFHNAEQAQLFPELGLSKFWLVTYRERHELASSAIRNANNAERKASGSGIKVVSILDIEKTHELFRECGAKW